ncbi:MAG: FMN-binding protein [Actinomycetota bacterium]|nr:FMN-binding protein [Actinomycetota bacterium]
MRRIVSWALSTVTVLVLLFSYHTSTSSVAAAPEQVAVAGSSSSSGSGGATSGGTTAQGGTTTRGGTTQGGTTAQGGTPAGASSTVAGSSVSTAYGPVQVQISVASGKISAVSVLQVPNQNGRDQQINSRAVPILNREAVAAQSAKIDTVSGATYTSGGYIQSLQSAIDKAHL